MLKPSLVTPYFLVVEQFRTESCSTRTIYLTNMAANNTLLCIHRDPAQLSLLRERGYKLVTATNRREGLWLCKSNPVDAIVLEYHVGLPDGGVIAAEIKQAQPNVPIVMLADDVELSNDALKSVDALVARSDGPDFLLATLHFVLNVKPWPSVCSSNPKRTRRM
jgi:CheY-like chemotaxis protein